MKENANKLHFECTDFNSSTCVTVYAECINVLTEYLKYLAIQAHNFSSIKCGWHWKQPVGYSECSKCRPFALTQARSRSPHSSTASLTTLWGMLDQVSIRRCLRSAVSKRVPAWDSRYGSRPGSSPGCLAASGRVQWNLESPAAVAGSLCCVPLQIQTFYQRLWLHVGNPTYNSTHSTPGSPISATLSLKLI